MKVRRRRHPIWKLWYESNKHFQVPISPIFGEWQYIYTSPKGRISLIELLYSEQLPWEICGGGFQDIERFKTKEDAEVKIKELLD